MQAELNTMGYADGRHVTAEGARLIALALSVASTGLVCATEPDGAPRIILIVVDTLRQDYVSVYGSRVSTPTIDALAERGQIFPNAVSSFHQTTMSMASMFTGRTPSLESGTREHPLPWTGSTWCGLARFASSEARDSCVPQGLTTLAENLQEAGYWTVGVVANELLFRPYGFDQGFDEWIEVGLSREVRRELLESLPPLLERRRADADARSAGNVNQRAIRALRDRPHDPFFLYLHYMDVHDHALLPDPYRDLVVGLDREIDGLFAELNAEGLLEGTYVLFTSDHGEALGEEHALPATEGHYGNPSFEPVLRVPLIVAPPAFEDTTDLIRSQDISKLIKRLAGIAQERAPTSFSRDARPGELFLSELRYQTYREGRWKSTWPRAGGAPYLFDLEEDPQESINQAVVQAEVVQRHRERIDALGRQLATRHGQDAGLSGEDRERLRALGYLE